MPICDACDKKIVIKPSINNGKSDHYYMIIAHSGTKKYVHSKCFAKGTTEIFRKKLKMIKKLSSK